MSTWSIHELRDRMYRYDSLSRRNQEELITVLNQSYTPELVEKQFLKHQKALENIKQNKYILSRATQHYPECLCSEHIKGSGNDLTGYALLLTAGGDGERLRESLTQRGISHNLLKDFTKATHPLPDFFNTFGTLSVNLALISKLCRAYSITVPVIVTTGPKGSTTARVIPSLIKSYKNFGIKNLKIIEQDSRLHFTKNGQIAYTFSNNKPSLITNPDETGGPIMKLKSPLPNSSESSLDWVENLGCTKIILLQATAIYDPTTIITMASCGKNYDGLGIGIQRKEFPSNDPYGTYVVLKENTHSKLAIIESEIRNSTTVSLQDNQGSYFLPYNTGLYVLDITLIKNNALPDYATPPKEILPGIKKSPKIGYAATDCISFAKKPAVLTIPDHSYKVLKKYEDLAILSKTGKKFALDTMCKEIYETYCVK